LSFSAVTTLNIRNANTVLNSSNVCSWSLLKKQEKFKIKIRTPNNLNFVPFVQLLKKLFPVTHNPSPNPNPKQTQHNNIMSIHDHNYYYYYFFTTRRQESKFYGNSHYILVVHRHQNSFLSPQKAVLVVLFYTAAYSGIRSKENMYQ
jgi:hypothetical protein